MSKEAATLALETNRGVVLMRDRPLKRKLDLSLPQHHPHPPSKESIPDASPLTLTVKYHGRASNFRHRESTQSMK